jgi:hypothetical protein
MLLKSLAVGAFKIHFQGFFAPSKNSIFSKIQKLSKIPPFENKKILLLYIKHKKCNSPPL